MPAIPRSKMTADEFLEFERSSKDKHEYFGGQLFAMAGGSREHNVIVWNFSGELRKKLKGRDCEAYTNDMRVFIPETGLYTYPDLSVVCMKPEFQDSVNDTLLNPVLIVEVLSETTENYDRGKKFQNYRSLESLREYFLVSTEEPRIEKFQKTGDGFWFLTESVGLEASIILESIDCVVTLDEIYDRIDFSTTEN